VNASDVTENIPRTKSAGELPNAKQKAFQELRLLICKNGGKMDWQLAKTQLSYTSYMEVVKPGFQEKMAGNFKFLSNNRVIQAKVRLQVCPKQRKDSNCRDYNCQYLHLCPYHILNRCNFPTNCKNSHKICDKHTNDIFKMKNLSALSEEERLQLLRNIAYVIPEICIYYNNLTSCRKGANCTYLHVCKYWVKDYCKYGVKCERAHTFNNEHEQKILKKNNLDRFSEAEIKEKLNEHYR
jgi:hypothetical protein